MQTTQIKRDNSLQKLALTPEILMQIEKPARYLGNEVNAANKDPKSVDVRFVMCFPDVYEGNECNHYILRAKQKTHNI